MITAKLVQIFFLSIIEDYQMQRFAAIGLSKFLNANTGMYFRELPVKIHYFLVSSGFPAL